jgi:hypothetical protein
MITVGTNIARVDGPGVYRIPLIPNLNEKFVRSNRNKPKLRV